MSKDLEFLSRIVRSASELIGDKFEVRAKDDKGDLVTNLDFEIEKYLIDEIGREYPGFTVVSEEYNSENRATENCFVIDPIDGTINFANGLPLWGIQVACVRGGKVCAAVIYLAALGEFYEADESGAYLNGEKIGVNHYGVDRGLCDIEGPDKRKYQGLAMKEFRHVRNINSAAVVFAWVAAGRLSAATYLGWDKLWDYLPGRYLVEKAGGVVFDAEGVHLVANCEEWLGALKELVGVE